MALGRVPMPRESGGCTQSAPDCPVKFPDPPSATSSVGREIRPVAARRMPPEARKAIEPRADVGVVFPCSDVSGLITTEMKTRVLFHLSTRACMAAFAD